jgi:hypothetical protein
LSTTTSAHPGFDPSGGQGKALLETTNGNSTAIMMNGNLNLLIVYAHDSPQHEQAVLALADFLRDVFGFDVHVSLCEVKVWSVFVAKESWDKNLYVIVFDPSFLSILNTFILNLQLQPTY